MNRNYDQSHQGPLDVSRSTADPNIETLSEAGEVGQYFAELYELALGEKPCLIQVKIHAGGKGDFPILEYTGGKAIHQGETDHGRPEIVVNTEDGWDHFNNLRETRPVSTQVSAEKAGIGPEEITGEVLAGFIFLHELGHTLYYLERAPDVNKYREQRSREMDSLPVKGHNPASLIKIMKCEKGEGWWGESEVRRYYAESYGVNNPEELVLLQEREYHGLPTEHFPDMFAANVLNKYLRETE